MLSIDTFVFLVVLKQLWVGFYSYFYGTVEALKSLIRDVQQNGFKCIRNFLQSASRYNILLLSDWLFSQILNFFFEDPIVARHVPLLSSQWPVNIILLCYLVFVLKAGKIFMEHRKPYDLKNVILVYNVCQMIYNAVMFSFVSFANHIQT